MTIIEPTANVSSETAPLTKLDRSKKKLTANGAPPPHEPSHLLPIGCLVPSSFQYRKTFDAVKLAELADSIRAHGFLEDLLVRPSGTGEMFEIVFGERRYRAAKLAGVTEIPCKVRTLSDVEAVELMIVENSQRVDVDPLEEAEGFETLHTKLGQSAEEIAAKIGKSVSHVYNRLKLTALSDAGRKAYREGRLTSYTAMLVARIPDVGLQKKAIAVIDGSEHWNNEPLSAREAFEVIRTKFMLALDKAPFDRGSLTLLPAAGACSDCPKRTGKQAELFADVKSPDVCTDPTCYSAKTRAASEEKLKELAAKGATVLDAKATKAIFGTTGNHVHDATGFVALDDRDHSRPKSPTFRSLLKGATVDKHVAIAPNGAIVEMVKRAAVERFAPKPTGSSTSASQKNREADHRKKLAHKKTVTALALSAIHAAAAKKAREDKAWWLFLALAFIENAGHETALAIVKTDGLKVDRGYRESHAVGRFARTLSADELRGLVARLAASVGSFYGESIGAHVKAGAEALHVDLGKIEAEAKKAKTGGIVTRGMPSRDAKAIARAAKSIPATQIRKAIKATKKKGRRS